MIFRTGVLEIVSGSEIQWFGKILHSEGATIGHGCFFTVVFGSLG